MFIKVLDWINTRTYFTDNVSSISFIEDLNNQLFYLLKGNLSDLWNLIVQYQDYKKIYALAKENSFENELGGFIAELQQKHLIITDKIFSKQINKYLTLPIKRNIKNFIFFEKIQSKIAAQQNLLSTLYLTLNYDCNLKCKHCCNPKTMCEKKITYKIAKKIIDDAYISGINEICLTGGECTINKDFIRIAEYIRSKHLKLYIFTNGQKFYDDKILFNKIVKLYPTTIQISLYSMKPEIHDYITQVKGSYYKTINTIQNFRAQNINVLVSCFQTAYNLNEDTEVKKYTKTIGAQFLTGCTFINNINNNNLSSKISSKEIENYYIKNIDIKRIRNKFEKNNELICSAGVDKLCITPNLDITPCIYFDYILGNYNSTTIEDVKNKIIPKFHKKFITKNLKDCFNYDYCEYCTYCPTYTENDNSGFLAKSPILCEDAIAYKKALEFIKENHNKR